jgi:hypothetical protein
MDAAELLDVDMDQLARTLALIADRRLEPEPAKLAHPDLGQDPRDRGACHPQALGDLCPGLSQPPQRGDRFDAPFIGSVGDPRRCRAAVLQAGLGVGEVALAPLAAGALAHSGGRGRLRERPALLEHPTDHQLAPLRTERRVSVNLHPVSSLGD